MRLDDERESRNVEDRRGMGFSGAKGMSLGTVALALIGSLVFGVNPLEILGLLSQQPSQTEVQSPGSPAQDAQTRFVSQVLASTEDVWQAKFSAHGSQYREPRLVLFRGSTQTACGYGQSAMGPFYCPPDEKVYIDLAFYDTLQNQLGAPGDFAQAYVIAHEVGHHVQTLLGTSEKVNAMRSRLNEREQNALSVKVELQADCYAGIWAHDADAARQILQEGDVEEALTAAAHIGDDALQHATQGQVVPETFTHGTSEQRVRWFKKGLQSGELADCNTFTAADL